MEQKTFPFTRRGVLVLALAGGALAAACEALQAATFIRGDANGDGTMDIADPIALLGHLYTAMASIPCLDAGDVDDSGGLDISDAIASLGFLYLGGEAPREPSSAPGLDPTPDTLDCAGEPDVDEDLAAPGLAGVGEDQAALTGWTASSESRAAGEPIFLDALAFDALLGLESGQSVQAALGEGAEPFLAAFFRGEPPQASGPPPIALDAIVGAGPDGCFRIPAALIDGRSQPWAARGKFRRGDLDGNGKVDSADAQDLLRCLDGAGLCPDHCWDAGDANDDGEVNFDDLRAILRAALGDPLPPPAATGCGPDPTPDGLPECSAGWCASPEGRTLIVQPEWICGVGPHQVELICIDEDGSEGRGQATVTLCASGDAGCPDSPMAIPPDDPTKPGLVCRWIVEEELDPEGQETDLRQTVYEGDRLAATRHSFPLLCTTGAMEIYRTDNGPGPVHYLFANRMAAICKTPPTQLSFVKSGHLRIRVNLLCLRNDGSNPAVRCHSSAEVEGTYASRVEAETVAGQDCGEEPNSVDALAQDEALVKANLETLFSKAVAVQNGNEVSTHPSFSTDFGLGYGKQGLAANAGIRFGYSSTRTNQTGRSADLLEGFGNATLNLPLTVHLWSKGRIEVSAFHRTAARAKCATKVAGVWLVAETDCPVDAPLFISAIMGEETEVERAKRAAEQFRLSRQGP